MLNMLRGGWRGDLMSSFRSGSTIRVSKPQRRPFVTVSSVVAVLVLLSFGMMDSTFALSDNLSVYEMMSFDSTYSFPGIVMTVWDDDVTDIHKIDTTNYDTVVATTTTTIKSYDRACSDRFHVSMPAKDTTSPVFTIQPSNITLSIAPTYVEYVAPSATDDTDDQVDVSCTPPTMTPFGTNMSHEITCIATDDANNTAMVSFWIVVADDITEPVVAAPASITVSATGILTTVDLGTATATDNTDDNLTITNNATSNEFEPGVHTILWTSTDSSGNTGTATQTITIVDDTDPQIVFTSGSSVSVLLNSGVYTYSGIACTDNTIDGQFDVTSRTGDEVDTSMVGVYNVIYTCTDNFGNSVSATQTVTVVMAVDAEPPVVTAPVDTSIEAIGEYTKVIAEANGTVIGSATGIGIGTAMDSMDGTLTPILIAPSDGLQVGTHTVTWNATDSSGNTGTATQNVIVVDTTPPVVTPPTNVTMEATGLLTTVDIGTASATDLVDGVLTLTHDQSSSTFGLGTHIITWSATDGSGNTGTATQNVTITDNTPPVVTPPTNVTMEATGLLTTVDIGTASATDLVDSVLTLTRDQSSSTFGLGTHIITWSATDGSGNTGTATQNVTITDNTPPVVTPPTNVTMEATGLLTTVDIGTASATDLVDSVLTLTRDQSSSTFGLGTHIITWSATDGSGNTGTATQNVTITDNTPPVVKADKDATIAATAELTMITSGTTNSIIGTATAVGIVTAIDLVDGAVTFTHNATSGLGLGTHIIIWSATDSSGNTGNATQSVIVEDTTAPEITLIGDTELSLTVGDDYIEQKATCVDLVDGTFSVLPFSGSVDTSTVGSYTLEYRCVDESDNESEVLTRTVTVSAGDIQ